MYVPLSTKTIVKKNHTMERVSLKQNRNQTGVKDVLNQIRILGRVAESLSWQMVFSKNDGTSISRLISSYDVTVTDLQPTSGKSVLSPLDSEQGCDYDRREIHDFGGYV